MKVFLIGGAGFIGSHVCRELVMQGCEVTVYGPLLQEALLDDVKDQIERIEGDILDPHRLYARLLHSKPDLIVHLAAFGAGSDGLAKSAQHSPQKALDVNIMGFYHVLEAAKVAGVAKIIWSGSSTVFGPKEQYQETTVNEFAACSPTTLYGSTKVMNELMTRFYRSQYQMEVCGVRLPLVYGPGRWYKGAGGALVDIFEQSLTKAEVVVSGDRETMDLMYVKDVARLFAHLASSQQPLSDVYNVKSHTTSLPEMVQTVTELLPDYPLKLEIRPSSVVYPLMDTSKIQREQNFYPLYTLQDACQDYLAEMRRNQK